MQDSSNFTLLHVVVKKAIDVKSTGREQGKRLKD